WMCLAGLVCMVWHSWTAGYVWNKRRVYLEAENQLLYLRQEIKQTDKPILADHLSGIDVVAGKSVYFQPFIMRQLAEQGWWRSETLAAAACTGMFSYVLIFQSEQD